MYFIDIKPFERSILKNNYSDALYKRTINKIIRIKSVLPPI